MVLRYDGSLAGFLCLCGRAVKERIEVDRVVRGQTPCSGDLFSPEMTIATDRDRAATVASGLEDRLGKRFLKQCAQALFSEEEQIEGALVELVRRALRQGPGLLDDLADPLVNRIDAAALRTGRERHRLLGLLRFVRLADDSYLARVTPRCNVVPLLGSHFSRRLPDQRWLILDERRLLGVYGEGGRWQLAEQIEMSGALASHPAEAEVASLWRSFYRHVSNPQRHNPRLRQQLMPKHYWNHLTELQEG